MIELMCPICKTGILEWEWNRRQVYYCEECGCRFFWEVVKDELLQLASIREDGSTNLAAGKFPVERQVFG